MPDRFAPTLPAGPAMLTIRPLQGRTGLMLAGEADITAQRTLRAALAGLAADRTGDIHLDLTALRFIDLSCARELIAVTEHHPAARVVAHNPPASLLRITALIGWRASITTAGRPRPLTAAAGRAGPAAGAAGLLARADARIRRRAVAPGKLARRSEEVPGSLPPSRVTLAASRPRPDRNVRGL